MKLGLGHGCQVKRGWKAAGCGKARPCFPWKGALMVLGLDGRGQGRQAQGPDFLGDS
jgi:hypothetical protein